MDLGTIIGILGGFGLIVMAITLDGSIMAFVNTPGLIVVIGGTICATLIHARLKEVISAFGLAKYAILDRSTPIEELIRTIHAHPTMSEAVAEAAHATHGAPLHM